MPALENLFLVSTKQAIAIPLAINASLLNPILAKKAVRIAPWWPDKPPKKPDSNPPTGSHLIFIPDSFPPNKSLVAKAIKTNPIIRFTGVILSSIFETLV